MRKSAHSKPITDAGELEAFLESRANFVAQASLFGYVRTRTGGKFPLLFDDEAFAASLNIARWQIWLACLADLSVYSGGLIHQRSQAPTAAVGQLIEHAVDTILSRTGVPQDAGPEFAAAAVTVRQRIRSCDWTAVRDDESAFTESPAALVHWAPIVDEFKKLDEKIVRNSVRFRWQEVRRSMRKLLQAETLMHTIPRSEPLANGD
ncbi:MAG: esterase [Gammaproteobacteria bacterium]